MIIICQSNEVEWYVVYRNGVMDSIATWERWPVRSNKLNVSPEKLFIEKPMVCKISLIQNTKSFAEKSSLVCHENIGV